MRKRRGLPVRAFAAVLIASPTLKIPIRQIGREAFGKCAKNLRVVFSRVLPRDCSIYVGGKNMSRGFICCAIFLRKFKGAALRALRTLSARFISASHAFRVRCLRAAPAPVSVFARRVHARIRAPFGAAFCRARGAWNLSDVVWPGVGAKMRRHFFSRIFAHVFSSARGRAKTRTIEDCELKRIGGGYF